MARAGVSAPRAGGAAPGLAAGPRDGVATRTGAARPGAAACASGTGIQEQHAARVGRQRRGELGRDRGHALAAHRAHEHHDPALLILQRCLDADPKRRHLADHLGGKRSKRDGIDARHDRRLERGDRGRGGET
jgi:hypothetical protein